MRLSAVQVTVLAALVAAGGTLTVAELVRRHGGSVSVARASTSRRLRRLWDAGHVELHDRRGGSLTSMRHRGIRSSYITMVTVTSSGMALVHGPSGVNAKGSQAAA